MDDNQCLYRLRNKNKWGYVNSEGVVIIPFIYDYAHEFHNGYAQILVGKEAGYIDKSGNIIVQWPFGHQNNNKNTHRFSNVFHPKNGFAAVILNDKWGYIESATGKLAIPCIYEWGGYFNEGLAAVYQNDKWGYIDKLQNVIIPFKYEDASEFVNGLAPVRFNGKWGYIDKQNNVVIPFNFSDAIPFSEGLASVCQNDKWGYIDQSGTLVIPYAFDSAFEFSEGLAIVELNGKLGLIDTHGNIVSPCIYDYIFPSEEGRIAFQRNKKWGFMDELGNEIISPIFRMCIPFQKGISQVRIDIKAEDKNSIELYIDKDEAVKEWSLKYLDKVDYENACVWLKRNGLKVK